jgi:MFS family permease
MVSLLAGTSVGLYNPIIAVMMNEDGISDMLIGAASSLFFLSVIMVSPLAGYLTQRVSMRAALIIGMTLSSLASCAFSTATTLTDWFAFRAVLGFGIGLYLIGGQSAVNTFANDTNRTTVNGIHALAFGIGMGIGPILGSTLFDITPALAFYVCGFILFLGVPIVAIGLPVEVAKSTRRIQRKNINKIMVALYAVFAYGAIEAILLSLFPVFMLDRGYSMSTMTLAFSCFVAGGIISTVPMTKWADRVGQEKVLAFCSLFGVLGSITMTMTTNSLVAMFSSALTGGCLGPVFALALALMGRLLPKEDLAGGSALPQFPLALGH